jgi:NAD(P)-dependent dehydrogenase (short-subunit alcohol dehydrogenase family)
VNTASAAGLVGLPGGPAYVAAKHGVAGLTKTAALEFARKGIRINAVCPGFIRTPMVERALDKGTFSEEQIFAAEPMHRMGKPEEIAEAVLWLNSEASSFVTGLPMPVDGGYLAQYRVAGRQRLCERAPGKAHRTDCSKRLSRRHYNYNAGSGIVSAL